MSSPVISVEHLSKAYRIGVKEEIPDTLMGAMKNVITAPWKNFNALRRLNTSNDSLLPITQSPTPASSSPLPHCPTAPLPNPDTLWALREVSFEINQGEVVGIIGRNGAGKSTLLKVLSRITEPTSGRVVIRGRVSSLLEVGTGFHPELTGRENVYMNGTILGMRKKEIDRKFDEIVNFSGVERFLDTPIKRYSSGMQVRLAFAVAAHLEPEILIVDEVLAVGDNEFQKKCIGKMQDVAKGGRTVLFVSHNMAAMQTLCKRGITMSAGTVSTDAKIATAIATYLGAKEISDGANEVKWPVSGKGIQVLSATLKKESADLLLVLKCEAKNRFPTLGIGFEITTLSGMRVASLGAIHTNVCLKDVAGEFTAEVSFPKLLDLLASGTYRLSTWLSIPGSEKLVEINPVAMIKVPFADLYSNGKETTCENNGPLNARISARFYRKLNHSQEVK